MTILWLSGWAWSPPHPQYLQMIMAIRACLGGFLILAPHDPAEHGHLPGGVPGLFLAATVLAAPPPRGRTAPA